MPFNVTILKNLRKEAGFTQDNLAKEIELSRETVVAIEGNKPKTVNALQLSVVNEWWQLCREKATDSTALSFRAEVSRYFGM